MMKNQQPSTVERWRPVATRYGVAAGTQVTGAVLQAVRSHLFDWRPLVLAGMCWLLMLLVVQFAFTYVFRIGQSNGPGRDLPFLSGFNDGENAHTDRSFRWTRAQSQIEVPGIGQRDLIVAMQILSHQAQWYPDMPPPVVEVQLGNRTPVSVTLRQEEAHYLFFVPASVLERGTLRMQLTTTPWQHELDQRSELGVAVGRWLTIRSTPTSGLVWPDLLLILAWPFSLVLFWLMLRSLGFAADGSFLALLPLVVLLPLLTLFEAPRLAFGSVWIIQVGLMCIAFALLLRWLVPRLLQRLGVAPPPAILRWLLLLMVLTFALKYGARLYPEAMYGDLQLHVNRYIMTIHGRFFIRAQHRGLPFPFPNALYVMIAPLTLTGLGIHFLFEVTAGLFEAAMVLLLYVFIARLMRSPRYGLLTAATYALVPAGFMTTWFAFETQVAALWFSALLMTVLVLRWPDYSDWWTWGMLVFLFAQAFLGHIGQFINTVLLGLIVVPVLWWRYTSPLERRGTLQILGAGVVAGLFAGLFYYSRFTGLFLDQLQGMADGGLNEITGREPIPREVTLAALWQHGLLDHFGFFPVLLALIGALILFDTRLRQSILTPLIWFTFLVAASQAVLPLITLSSITTRWLLFATWAICVSATIGFSWLWRRGRSARVVSMVMAGYVGWITLGVWINAMAFRTAPVEPF